jgi:hypothetical protein
MGRFAVLVVVVATAMMVVGAGSASAFTGGGKKPSEAPIVTWGAHYEASVGNNHSEANYLQSCCSSSQASFWHLGPLDVHDQVVVNWHELPFAHGSGYPVRMFFLENVEDFNWGSIFGEALDRYRYYEITGSGTARTEITVQNSSPNDYLVFYSGAETTESQHYETYPYDFGVEAPRHYLSLALGGVQKVATNGFLHATATLATGAPVPDGYPFALTGTWSDGGVFTTTAVSVAGQVTFPLALPETAIGKSVSFVASSGATGEYQAASSAKMNVEVTKPIAAPAPAPPANICKKATNKAHAIARKYKRQLRNAERARGRARHRLLHEAHATERKFLAARSAKQAAC